MSDHASCAAHLLAEHVACQNTQAAPRTFWQSMASSRPLSEMPCAAAIACNAPRVSVKPQDEVPIYRLQTSSVARARQHAYAALMN